MFSIKILHLVTRRQYRGAEVFAAELCTLLAGNGHTVLFVGLYNPGENILSAKGAENIDLNGKKTAFDPFLLLRLFNLIKSKRPDILQANGSDTLKYAVFAGLLYPGLNIVYRNISMVSAWVKDESFKKKINKWLFKHVDRVTSVGQQSLDDLVKTYGYPVNKTKLIRRGVPEFNVDPALSRAKISSEFNFSDNDPILAHIGQFSPEKNHIFLIQCFEKILERVNDARLLFIGEGKSHAEVIRLVIEKGLSGNIFFTGHRENVQEILAGCDLFILGSTVEGVPGVVLEAGMQSLPTVAVSVGGVSEVVINGTTGLLVQKHLIPEFTNAVVSLLQDTRLRRSLGENAKAFVLENYSLKHCLHQFEDLYTEILSEQVKGLV